METSFFTLVVLVRIAMLATLLPLRIKTMNSRPHVHKKAGLPSIMWWSSATRLSHGDPLGFPPHPRGWFSIIVYQVYSVYVYVSIAW